MTVCPSVCHAWIVTKQNEMQSHYIHVCDHDERNILDFRSSDFASDAHYMSDVTHTIEQLRLSVDNPWFSKLFLSKN